MKMYRVSVQDTPDKAEQAIRLLEKVFRWRYNVHGVHRDASAIDRETGELKITVSLRAKWMDTPNMIGLFPEYTPEGIYRAWMRLVSKDSMLDNAWIFPMEMIEG